MTTMLPDLQQVVERTSGANQAMVMRGQNALAATQIWQDGSQIAMGGAVQSIGIPSAKIFKTIVKQFKIDPAADVVRKIEEVYGSLAAGIEAVDGPQSEAMQVSAGAGVATGVSLVTAVPVVGMVAAIAWNVGKLIYSIASLARAQRNYEAVKQVWPETRFDPSADNTLLNLGLLDQVRLSNDWSNMFSPPSLGEGVGTLPPYGIKRLESGAIEIFRRSGYAENGAQINWPLLGWVGMVPGTGTLHAGVRSEGRIATEIGETLFPSARGVATWLWKQVAGPRPLAALFAVEADLVAARWEAYIAELHEFINESKDLNIDEKAAIIAAFNADSSGAPIFGWGTTIAVRKNEWDNYHPRRMCDEVRARQFKACDTLLIAYVDETFGAFNDTALRDRLRQRRKDLLQHPAICEVDLDSVIDPDYKDALRTAGAGSMHCNQIRPVFAATPKAPFPPVTDTGSGGAGGYGGLDVGVVKKRSRMKWLLAALGVGAVGYAATKLRK